MKRALSKVWPFVATALVFAVIFFRIPFRRLVDALEAASLGPFLALMIVFSLAYFAIDTLVLVKMIRWFHGPRPLLKRQPFSMPRIRAAAQHADIGEAGRE
jgi:hypothetical protein